MSDKGNRKPTALNSSSIFFELPAQQQQQIIDQTSEFTLKSGETLIKEVDEADTLYFLLKGRLIVFLGKRPIAEILPGESIGEIAFLNGGTRTASVIASRNCKLLQLDKINYNTLINDIPEISKSIIKSLADRLTVNNISIPELEPKVSNIVALLPAGIV